MASFVMPLVLSGFLIWFFLAFQKKKHQAVSAAKDAMLREQSLIILSQQNIEKERNRIAAEMHDDLGSGLTTIKYLSEKAISKSADNHEIEEIKKISNYSNELVHNMAEIIWAMNSRFDNTQSLSSYIRRYASEYMEENNIELYFSCNFNEDLTMISGEKRRNIFLIIKEILHNIVKYSNATAVNISLDFETKYILIIEEINGVGFDITTKNNKGNGLFNINKRANSINGTLKIERQNSGMKYILAVP
jgi:signal transduction histidine kinase